MCAGMMTDDRRKETYSEMSSTSSIMETSKDELANKNVAQLIEAVQQFPLLWDVGDMEYRNTMKKMNGWRMVSEEIGVSVDVCQKKWKNIMDSFRRSLAKPKSGSKGKKPYVHGERLNFLLPTMEKRNTTSNFTSPESPETYSEVLLGPSSDFSTNLTEIQIEGTDDAFFTDSQMIEQENISPNAFSGGQVLTDSDMISKENIPCKVFSGSQEYTNTPIYPCQPPTRGRKRKNSSGELIANCVETLINRKQEDYLSIRARGLVDTIRAHNLTRLQATKLFNEFELRVLEMHDET